MPPPRLPPPRDPPLRLPPELRPPPLLLPELPLPPELDLRPPTELLFPELFPELLTELLPELLLLPDPDRGFTEPPVDLLPVDPLRLVPGLTLPPDRVRSAEPERLEPLPGRTCRVRSLRSLDCPLRPEFQTRVPFCRGSTGLILR